MRAVVLVEVAVQLESLFQSIYQSVSSSYFEASFKDSSNIQFCECNTHENDIISMNKAMCFLFL